MPTMTMPGTMKAVRIRSFGGPEVLRYEDVPRPEPRGGEMLVRVHAAGVNPVDWKIREGHIPVPLPAIMGIDFSGEVEALGPDVREFRVGDAVKIPFAMACARWVVRHASTCASPNVAFSAGCQPIAVGKKIISAPSNAVMRAGMRSRNVAVGRRSFGCASPLHLSRSPPKWRIEAAAPGMVSSKPRS